MERGARLSSLAARLTSAFLNALEVSPAIEPVISVSDVVYLGVTERSENENLPSLTVTMATEMLSRAFLS